jgi:hypothetical protein
VAAVCRSVWTFTLERPTFLPAALTRCKKLLGSRGDPPG